MTMTETNTYKKTNTKTKTHIHRQRQIQSASRPKGKYFLRGEYFSGWINFRVNKFQGWMFSRGHRSSYSLNIWLSANILGLVIIIIDIMSWHFAGQVNLFGYLERWACWMLSKLFSAMHWNEGSTATMRHGTSWQLGLFSKYSSLFCIKVVSEG